LVALLPLLASSTSSACDASLGREFRNHDRFLPVPRDGFSSFLCFGGEAAEGFTLGMEEAFRNTEWKHRTCAFRNLGVSPDGSRLIFHQNPKQEPLWDYFNSQPVTSSATIMRRFEKWYG
jgi:hypothetical protein